MRKTMSTSASIVMLLITFLTCLIVAPNARGLGQDTWGIGASISFADNANRASLTATIPSYPSWPLLLQNWAAVVLTVWDQDHGFQIAVNSVVDSMNYHSIAISTNIWGMINGEWTVEKTPTTTYIHSCAKPGDKVELMIYNYQGTWYFYYATGSHSGTVDNFYDTWNVLVGGLVVPIAMFESTDYSSGNTAKATISDVQLGFLDGSTVEPDQGRVYYGGSPIYLDATGDSSNSGGVAIDPPIAGMGIEGNSQNSMLDYNAVNVGYGINLPQEISVLWSGNGRTSGWRYNLHDLARTEYYARPTKYSIPDTPFETLWSSPHEGKNLMALTGDVNGDGKLEVVKVSGDNLKVISGAGTGLWTQNIPGVDSYYGTGYLSLNMLGDVTGDGIPEIFVSRKTSDTVGVIYVYDGSGNLLKTLTRTVGSDGNMWATAMFDVNNDGNKEILCGITSNYVGNPRGACLFDYNTGNELWFYAAGNAIGSSIDSIADLNNDGTMEISSGWWTVHNGASGSGKGSNTYTDDSSVYVVVISENGDEIFTWQIHDTHNHGGAFERITDLNRDGTRELVVFHSHEGSYPGYSQVFLLSPTGAILNSFTGSYNAIWYLPAIADINKDGKDEMIVGCNDGLLRVFDYSLNVVASSSHNYGPQAVTDLNGDGKLEIVVSDYSTKELVILDDNLNELWKLSFPVVPTAIVSDVNGDGANELVITADQLYVAANPTTTKGPTPVFNPEVNKISLRYEITPVDTTFTPGTNANVAIYDVSNRESNALMDLGLRAEDVYIGSFTFDVFRNRDADSEITRDEVVQNFYEAVPQSILQDLSTYISKTHVLYSDLSTVDFLFANFALQILEGTRPQATQAFSVLTFLLPVPLVDPTYVYSQYGYKLAGTWSRLGGGFGTGSLKTVSVYCYADLRVMNSLGRVMNKTINEIPGAYYFEADMNNDGQLDDTVVLPDTPGLVYTIWVVPEPDAPMDSTYTLVFGSADIGILMAENVMLSDAPANGYELTPLATPQQTPPITTLTIGNPQYLTGSGNLFINSSTQLNFGTIVGSAQVASTAYKIQNATYSHSFSCTTPETCYLTDLSDGTYDIDYYSVDTEGSIEPTNNVTVILDDTQPSTNLAISQPKHVDTESTFVKVDTSFTLSADDELGSGVASIFYRISNTSYDSGWLPYANPFNLTGFADGNYTISYYSIDNVGNTQTSTHVVTLVTLPGDLNSDFTVDIFDAITLANAYNSKPSSSNWNPKADINGDGTVDIYDAIILANHYNQHYP